MFCFVVFFLIVGDFFGSFFLFHYVAVLGMLRTVIPGLVPCLLFVSTYQSHSSDGLLNRFAKVLLNVEFQPTLLLSKDCGKNKVFYLAGLGA